MDHVVDAVPGLLYAGQVGEAQRAVVVVELQGGDAGGVGLETQHQQITHQPHVFPDVLRDAVGRTFDIRFVEGGPPALQLAALAGIVDALLHVPHGVEILIKLALVTAADVPPQILGILHHRIQHALVPGRDLILEEPVEGQRRIQFQRRGGGRRTP